MPAVAKDEQRSALGIFAQAFLRRRPEAIEAGAQIVRRGGDKHFEMRLEAQHGVEGRRAWSKRAASSIWPASVIRTRACVPSSSTSSAAQVELAAQLLHRFNALASC